MSENTVLNQGQGGDTIATEDFGSYKIPREKIVIGVKDVDGGDVSASNPMPVGVIDASGNVVQGAQDASVVLLRKIVKLLETSAVQDAKQRQRVVVDAVGNNNSISTECGGSIPVNVLSAVGVADHSGNVVPGVQDYTIVLLRKIVKLLEASSIQDSKNRQRVTIDAVGNANVSASTECSGYVPVNINNIPSFYQYNANGNIIYPNSNTAAPTINALLPVDQRWEIIDRARMSYGASIRPNLNWNLK